MTADEFKKAFGLKANSTDWTKIIAMVDKKWSEASNFVNSGVLQGNEQTTAENELAQILKRVAQVNRTASDDKPAAGRLARDSLLPDMQAFLDRHRNIAKTEPLTVKVGNEDVKVFRHDIPGYDKMDKNARLNAIQDAAQKVARGNAVFDTLKNWDGNGNPPQASHDDAGALMWALKSKAQDKNGPFVKGAMVVPEGEKMRKYLDSLGGQNGEVYPRSSSHLTDQQKLPGQQARGMDFYEVNDDDPGKLPAGMKTLLYQQVTLPSGAKAMYLKMETAAAYGSESKNKFNGVKGVDQTMPVKRTERPGDKAHTSEHSGNFLRGLIGLKDKDPFGAKREDVPKEVQTAWKTYLKTVKDKTTKSALQSAAGSPFRINKVLWKLHELDQAGTLDEDDNFDAFLEVMDKHGTFNSVSDLDSRFGGEAVLTSDDFT